MRPFLVAALVSTLAAGAPHAAGTPQQPGISITFLANEGVMLSSGTKTVLIDALFQNYGPGFAVPADSTQAALASARAPFDSVDLVLVTHRHGDHFHPAPVATHLRANPRATLLTSQQVIDSLRHHVQPNDAIRPRMMSRTTRPGARQRVTVNGIAVELLGLPHGSFRHRRVEHLGYIVELGGRRVLHVGDTDIGEDAFRPFRLDTARIDVALVPQWMVTSDDGREVIRRWIRPKQVVAFHVDEGGGERANQAVRAALPGAVAFTRSLETRTW
ncbi:MAG TPA: MBL fold metallo-hydrolase [Gemmatimonadaceae bacterium]|jgi:L-ascorbate metabolism protein UlaG (beta-lactamase superfamily)|nr:MBL fold metallo-hydrolase [Gemmatimonadaceae bacterium]